MGEGVRQNFMKNNSHQNSTLIFLFILDVLVLDCLVQDYTKYINIDNKHAKPLVVIRFWNIA